MKMLFCPSFSTYILLRMLLIINLIDAKQKYLCTPSQLCFFYTTRRTYRVMLQVGSVTINNRTDFDILKFLSGYIISWYIRLTKEIASEYSVENDRIYSSLIRFIYNKHLFC